MKTTILAAAVLSAFGTSALASAFWPGEVIGVADDDTLNVRKWPASYSRIIFEYDSGDGVSLAGFCMNTVTKATFNIDGGQSSEWKHRKMRKANVWCKVMTPEAELGWVRGKYVWPE
jgi:hypothetical protein